MPEDKKHKVSEVFVTRAAVDPTSIVESDNGNTFEVVFATENPVFRRGWEENFNEILSIDSANMRLSRLENGAVPLLDNHSQWNGAAGQLGRVIEFKIAKGEARAKILFSVDENHKGIWENIKAGIIRSISTGYNVFKYIREPVEEGKAPNYRAVDWEPLEISLAPVPADFLSKIRNQNQEHEIQIENFYTNSNTMTEEQKAALKAERKRSAEIFKLIRAANLADEYGQELVESEMTVEQARTAIEDKKRTITIHNGNEPEIEKRAAKAEKQRAADIRTAVKGSGLDEVFALDLIERDLDVNAARAEIINKLAEKNVTPDVRTAGAIISIDEKQKEVNAIADAILHRASPGSVKLEDKAHDYKYMSLIDIARDRLQANGENARRFSIDEIIHRAISTTDYPNILNSTTERAIRRVYDAVNPEWKQIARQITAKDFRETNGIAIDQNFTFEEIAEGGEYKNAYLMLDDDAKIKLKTYGKKITITRQAIINDDLSVFDRLPSAIAYGAADFQAAKVWGLITGNKKTPDGKAIFHADHTNLATGVGNVGAPSADLLSKARTSMWRQKTPVGNPMAIAPKWLIVPIELLTAAEQLMTAIVANTTGNVNVWAGKLNIMTSPYLTSAAEWYLSGDTARAEGLVYAYLQGQEGLYIEKQIDFDNDAVVTKARLDFDCASWDYRNWYKNPGA